MKKIIAFLAIFTIVLFGCNIPIDQDSTTNPENRQEIKDNTFADITFNLGTYSDQKFDTLAELKPIKVKDESELIALLGKGSSSSSGPYRSVGGMAPNMVDDMAIESMSSESSAKVMDGGGSDFSQTNNQVTDVDEADLIKTDGKYIYTISDEITYIIDAYPGKDAEILTEIEIKDKSASNIFISENRLAVFGNVNDYNIYTKYDISPRNGISFFNIYDTTDKENPSLIKEYIFEGNYFNARLYDDKVYFLTLNRPVYNHPIPFYIVDNKVNYMSVSDIMYYPINYNSPQLLTITTLDINDGSKIDSSAITVESNPTLYMSIENIFIGYTQQINEWTIREEIQIELLSKYLTDSDKELIEKIKKTDNDVLSSQEKKSKINQIHYQYLYTLPYDEQEEINDEVEERLANKLEEYEYLQYTVLHKIGVDNGDINSLGDTRVAGRLNNQFAMDEYDEVLRLATTIDSRWDYTTKKRSDSSNNVFTLDKDMTVLDSLMDLAIDESIYSTRFIGEKLYMVTFKQIDPFFVIDLSNPKKIINQGELKIPGFSRYLHPYDENTIIGIGKDATDTGRTKGLKISLFDVSDVKNPKEITSFVSEERYAESNALWEHKAFLFSKEKNLLVIPAYSYSYNKASDSYNGAFVFDISKDNIELRGLIDHSKYTDGSYYYQPTVERSLYIEDELYTKSSNLLRINALSDLSSINEISLVKQNDKMKIY
jgi:inhibitor of cysteine peptidase